MTTNFNSFQNFIRRWYQLYGRHELPWRQTTDPYKILVSELMLQQTQVERVIPKYLHFIKQYPTPLHLAKASQAEALSLWQGLGYNRRLLNLKKTAELLTTLEQFPQETEELLSLPGVGPYTASAIQVFAFNKPATVIETNIRTIYLHHFFHEKLDVPDSKLLPLIEQSQYTSNPREWYAALMDYGSYLKKILPNPSRKSKHHTVQSNFRNSKRRVRGEILKLLTETDALPKEILQKKIKGNPAHFEPALQQLHQEGFIKPTTDGWTLQE